MDILREFNSSLVKEKILTKEKRRKKITWIGLLYNN